MNESAVPLVDVPAASTASEQPLWVRFDPSAQQLQVWLPKGEPDLLDAVLIQLSEALGPSGSEALTVDIDGAGARSDILRALLSFVTTDCDRAIQSVQLRPDARDALLQESIGRPAVCAASIDSDASHGAVRTTPPPVRPLLALAPTGAGGKDAATEAEATTDAEAEAEAEAEAKADPMEAPEPPAHATAELEPDAPTEHPAADTDTESELATECLPSASAVPADAPTHTAPEEASHSRPWGRTEDGDRRVLVLRRTVRSGKSVRFAGDVIIFGDVNHGAQVVADGDVVVLGRLRGLAHAGWRGDAEAIVVGLDMQSGQVRIGHTIAFPCPAASQTGTSRLAALLRRVPSSPNRSVTPSVARVVDGEIRIEDYHGRL